MKTAASKLICPASSDSLIQAEGRKTLRRICFLLISVSLFSKAITAQSACPSLTVSPNVNLCTGCTTLTAAVQGTVATTSYSVSSTPYSPYSYTGANSVLVNIDDTWSGVINIPFCFSFYGTTYNQCVIGSNAIISFDQANAGNYNTWSIGGAIPFSSPSDLVNCIMAPWHDIDPSVTSYSSPTITWQTYGTSPCRAFVVSWTNVSMFDCNAMIATSQAVLHETTNIIDIYIQNKPLCSSWNGGAAIEGIQDASGGQAVVVPGRNYPAQWTASNDGQRFTPSGAPEYTLTWYAPPHVSIGTTPAISVCPSGTTTYTATLVNNTCSGPITISSPVTVTMCGSVSCNFIAHGDTVCVGAPISLSADTVTNASYKWTGPNGFTSAVRNPSIAMAAPAHTGWYHVKDSITGCTSTDSVYVKVNPGSAANAGPDQTICMGAAAALAGTLIGAASSGIWSGGAGTYNPNDSTAAAIYTPSAPEITAGNVTLTFSPNASGGTCPQVNDQMVITIGQGAAANAGPDQTICIGTAVTLAGTIIGSSLNGTWSGGTGTYNPNDTTASAVYTPSAAEETAGTVTLTYTPHAGGGSCPHVSDQMTITISQVPTANAGSAQSVCPGANITLAGSIGGAATSAVWSGGTGSYSPNNAALNAVYSPSPAEYAADSVMLTLTTNDPPGSCTFSTSNVTFHFYPDPVTAFSVDSAGGCPIHCTGFINSTTIGGGDIITSWLWNFGDGSAVSDLSAPSHCFAQSGYYDIQLTASSNHGCKTSLIKSHLVHVYNVPIAAFISAPNDASVIDPTMTFTNQSSADVNYWHWNFGDSTVLAPNTASPVHLYSDSVTGSYWVTLIVHNTDGCWDTTKHEIIIGPGFTFYIPNAFSPDGNGINDYFYGSGTGVIKYDLLIFDRWGNQIFHTDVLSDKWDGKTDNGNDISLIDTYVWKVELTDVFNKKHDYIGTVTLVK